VLTAPYNSTNVPYAVAGAGTTWTWRVRCACSITPLDVSAYSAYGDTFSIPVAREMAQLEGLTVYPNPASDLLLLSFNNNQEETSTVEVLDMLGRVVLAQQTALVAGTNNLQIAVSSLEPGTYFVRIGQNEAQAFTVTR
jgi:hypothetical protein